MNKVTRSWISPLNKETINKHRKKVRNGNQGHHEGIYAEFR